MSSIQRILSNHRNLVVGAALTPSSVAPIADAVIELPRARTGTASAVLSGSFTGNDTASFEIEVLDTLIDSGEELVSEPVFEGVGSGTLTDVTAASVSAQEYSVRLADLGAVLTAAGTELESVSLVARTAGADGNDIHLNIDQSTLVFSSTDYSTLRDLAVADGGKDNPLTSAAWEWDTKIIGADEQIPSAAHRIVFGDDQTQIYTQYKRFRDGGWQYHFEPALARAVPKGTAVKFVTGGRTATLINGVDADEVYTDVVTLYDLCNGIRTASQMVEVDGVVANDRSPGGMAVRELKTRTDAHSEGNGGEGSTFATGFVDTAVGSNTYTELIEARCWANSRAGSDKAGLGHELWELRGSVSGLLKSDLATGELFTEPAGRFSLRIPKRLPDGYGVLRGKFTVVGLTFVQRGVGIDPPDVRPVGLALGPNAVDQTLTLTYKKRPSAECSAADMPVPNLNTSCLLGKDAGGGISMAYSTANNARLASFYTWAADLVRTNSRYDTAAGATQDKFIATPIVSDVSYSPEAVATLARRFESALASIDVLDDGTYKTAGEAAWDSVVTEFQLDMWDSMGAGAAKATLAIADETLLAGQVVHVYRDNDNVLRCRLNIANVDTCTHFVLADVASGDDAACYRRGINSFLSGLTPGTTYYADSTVPGGFTDTLGLSGLRGVATSATTIVVVPYPDVAPSYAVLSDRYIARLTQVLMVAGISPLGKADLAASGDGCWVDWNDAYYWEIQGSVGGGYAPAFTNHKYFSAKFNETGRLANATHEFAFQINVNPACAGELMVGDQIQLAIGDAAWPATYNIENRLFLELVAASDLYLTSGKDGDNTQTWNITGSESGPLTPYALNTDTPAPYSVGGLSFLITPGAIKFKLGDEFRFSVEGGHYKWRKNGGAWSSSTPLHSTATALSGGDGLELAFTPGAAPSFAAGDTWSFTALQPNAVSNVRVPDFMRWSWTGSAPTLVVDMGSAQELNALALAYHTLPAGATVLIEGGTSAGVYTESTTITLNRPAMVKLLDESWTVRYLRLTLGSAGGGAIGWLFAGMASQFEFGAKVSGRRDYKMVRAAGSTGDASQYLGRAWSGKWEWPLGYLSETDWDELVAIFDHAKGEGDIPMILLPQWSRPDEAWICTLNADQVELPEFFDMQPEAAFERRFGASLAFDGVVVS